MANTKENCYLGFDRSVLLELKKIYDILKKQKSKGPLGEVEQKALDELEYVFSEMIYRPFLQGDNASTLMNMQDKNAFVKAIESAMSYLNLNSSTLNLDFNNLEFRLGKILKGEEPVNSIGSTDSWSSNSLNKFISMFGKNGLQVEAFSSGCECRNQSISGAYVTFERVIGQDTGIVPSLMTMAFNNDIGLEIINTNEGLRFSMLINPYDVDAKIECMQKELEAYSQQKKLKSQSQQEVESTQQKIDSVVSTMLDYVRRVAPNMKKEFRINFCKFEDGKILFEEVNEERGIIRGYSTEEDFIKFYKEQALSEARVAEKVEMVPRVKASEVARAALKLFNLEPGKLSEALRGTVSSVRKMFDRKPTSLEK